MKKKRPVAASTSPTDGPARAPWRSMATPPTSVLRGGQVCGSSLLASAYCSWPACLAGDGSDLKATLHKLTCDMTRCRRIRWRRRRPALPGSSHSPAGNSPPPPARALLPLRDWAAALRIDMHAQQTAQRAAKNSILFLMWNANL